MKPIRTKYTQEVFGMDMPYRFVRTHDGAAIVVTWQGTIWERIKFLFRGAITIYTYNPTQPKMMVIVGEGEK